MNKINLFVNKTTLDNMLDLAEKTTTKELPGIVCCKADIENDILIIRAKRFMEIKNVSPTPEIQFIPEIDKNTLGIINGCDTISLVHTHTYCGDPSIGDFSKFTSREYIYKEGQQPPLVIATPDIVVTRCFFTFILLFPFSIIIDINGMGVKVESEKFVNKFAPSVGDNPNEIEDINRATQYAILPLTTLKDAYEKFNIKWKWRFNPEEELLNIDKNRDKILSNLSSELIKKIRENS
jgi:proteasome lid subunit RPN8/RPN11